MTLKGWPFLYIYHIRLNIVCTLFGTVLFYNALFSRFLFTVDSLKLSNGDSVVKEMVLCIICLFCRSLLMWPATAVKNELFLSELLLTVLLLFVHFIVAVALKLCAGNVLCYLEDARYSFISWHNVYSVTVWHSPLQLTVVLSSVYYCTKYILFPWIKCNIGKYRAAFLAFGIACIVCRAGSMKLSCVHLSHPAAAAGLLLWVWRYRPSAAQLILGSKCNQCHTVSWCSWTHTCYAQVHTFASLKNDIGTQQPFWFILEGVAVIHCVSKNDTDVACYNFNAC